MAHTRSFRQGMPATSAAQHSRPLLLRVSGVLVQYQCGLGDTYIAFLYHCSIVALVYIQPIRLAGIVVVYHFHLRVPKRRFSLPPGALINVRESTLDLIAYLVVAWKAQFCL